MPSLLRSSESEAPAFQVADLLITNLVLMARLSTGQLPAPAPTEDENNCLSSPTFRKGRKRKVTSCVSKINFLLQLYFVIISLTCFSEAQTVFAKAFLGKRIQCKPIESSANSAGKTELVTYGVKIRIRTKRFWLSKSYAFLESILFDTQMWE